MPECPEITILSQLLMSKLKGVNFEKLIVTSGKYLKKNLVGSNLIKNHKLENCDSKGKLLYMTLSNKKEKIYLISHLGLTGEWQFESNNNTRIKIITDKLTLYYNDPRNFGNIEIVSNHDHLKKKLDSLAPDVLKNDFDLQSLVKEYLSKSLSRKKQLIFKVLMKQNLKDGIVSGLGNYLTPEILYDAKISPFRTIGSLSSIEIKKLSKSIKYIVKLSYYNNNTGYMTNFGDFVNIHKLNIDNKIYPEYHENIKLNKTDKFNFKVYRQDKDPKGNKVDKDKTINKTRTTYWVKNIQK